MAVNDLLSEGELDALTQGQSAASPPGGYRSFDFGSREQSLLAQFTALAGLQQRQAEQLVSLLEAVFSSEFAVLAGSPRLMSCADLMASLDEVVAVTALELAPLAGDCYIISPSPLLSQLVNDYFGGLRGATGGKPGRAGLTPSELRLAERVADQLVGSLVATWADKLPLQPGVATTAANVDSLAAIAEGEKLLQLSFNVTCGESSGNVLLVLPFAALEPWKARFGAPRKASQEGTEHSWEPYFRRELAAVKVELAALLTSRELSLGEVLALRVGSVIELDVPDAVELYVEGTPLASGRFGRHKDKKAIRIIRLAGAAGGKTGRNHE